jgi:Rrf2 family protein
MISTRGRYALRVMIDLAKQPQDHYIPLKDIAERQGISKKYLEIIVKDLVNGKLVTGISGKGGGYRLSRKPEDIPVGEVIELTEGKIGSVACLENGAEPCPRADMCETLPMWKEYNQLIHDFFYSKRLCDLAE